MWEWARQILAIATLCSRRSCVSQVTHESKVKSAARPNAEPRIAG
jgi:hypothetical protein